MAERSMPSKLADSVRPGPGPPGSGPKKMSFEMLKGLDFGPRGDVGQMNGIF
jgi:hypothetical protein